MQQHRGDRELDHGGGAERRHVRRGEQEAAADEADDGAGRRVMRLQRHRGCDRGQQPRGGTEHGADRAVAEQAGSQCAWISDAGRGLVGALDENDDDAGSRDRRDRPGRS
jgi:hypothetical protein